ncbi:MAG: helix-turn-helix domain-containing protein, partial [Thiolinea sp.]
REDLFHRLNVIRMHSPPLRERRDDIPLLLEAFLHRAAEELQVENKTLSPAVSEFLLSRTWEGNVRQLENTCRWLTVMAAGQEVVMDDLPAELLEHGEEKTALTGNWEKSLAQYAEQRLAGGSNNLLSELSPIFESILLQTALNKTGGRKLEAAKLLGWGRNTLTRKLKELQMHLK